MDPQKCTKTPKNGHFWSFWHFLTFLDILCVLVTTLPYMYIHKYRKYPKSPFWSFLRYPWVPTRRLHVKMAKNGKNDHKTIKNQLKLTPRKYPKNGHFWPFWHFLTILAHWHVLVTTLPYVYIHKYQKYPKWPFWPFLRYPWVPIRR